MVRIVVAQALLSSHDDLDSLVSAGLVVDAVCGRSDAMVSGLVLPAKALRGVSLHHNQSFTFSLFLHYRL